MSTTDPHVTALCLTQPGREGLACRAALSFGRQTYANKRMLLLSSGHGVDALVKGLPGVTVVNGPTTDPAQRLCVGLGMARAFDAGGYVALWDDDDNYSPRRLERQLALAEQSGLPCFLSSGLWHFLDSSEVFVFDLERRHRPLTERVIPSTLLARTDQVPDALVPLYARGSPTAALGLAVQAGGNSVRPAGDTSWGLLRAGVRGDNASGYEWHRHWVNEPGRCKDVAWLNARRREAVAALGGYHWDGPVDVCGSDGVAYGYDAGPRWPEGTPPAGEPSGVERVVELGGPEVNNA